MRVKLGDVIKGYRVTKGAKFRLKDIDPGDTAGYSSEFKSEARALVQKSVTRLSELQEKLYAQDHWAVLLIFQAMDAAGKDGTIKHVMSGVNPQGCEVHSFKAPSAEELDHDFLWRAARRLPERGRIGIFNRSYYEEVLVVRVHPPLLARQHLPPRLAGKDVWQQRFEDINNFERYLAHNGIAVCKFFLHVSREEQKQRFLERIDHPEKNWKFQLADVREREEWPTYMTVYEDMIRNTASKHAPWYVVPADNKWFTRMVVASAVVDTLRRLDLTFPRIDAKRREELGGGARRARRTQTTRKMNVAPSAGVNPRVPIGLQGRRVLSAS
jgi:PPK2 family polyphosphate:nucleotide phosphotransferase